MFGVKIVHDHCLSFGIQVVFFFFFWAILISSDPSDLLNFTCGFSSNFCGFSLEIGIQFLNSFSLI